MRLTALLAVAALVAVGCGSDGGSTPAASTGGPQTSGGTPSSDDPAPAENDSAALYELAKEEGGLVVYTPYSENESRAAFFAAFTAAYPGIDVEHVGKPGQQILEQFLTEKRAGLDNADVIVIPEQNTFRTTFQDEGLVDTYVPEGAEVYPEEFTIPGIAYPSQTINIGAVYNADLVTDAEVELLKTYEGWADPVWRDRANVVSPASTPVGLANYYWAEVDQDLGWDWLERRAANREVVFTSAVPAVERVLAGEFAVSFNNYDVTSARQMGPDSPLRLVHPEYTMTTVFGVGLVSKASSPNSAKLFINWLLSKEGQEAVLNELGYPSVRPDVTDSPVQEPWYVRPTDPRAADAADAAAAMGDVLDRWNELFTEGG